MADQHPMAHLRIVSPRGTRERPSGGPSSENSSRTSRTDARAMAPIEEIRGTAHYVEYRQAPRAFGREAQDRLTFHLYSIGSSGQAISKTRVEMRSNRVGDLTLRDGDTVVVRGTRVRPNDIQATAINNLTARSELSLQADASLVERLKAPLAVLWFAAIPVFLLALVALICKRFSTGVTLGLPCIGIWVASWLLYQRPG